MQTSVVPESKPLSQMERFVDAFVAPTKTFTDIRRSSSWGLPFAVICVLALAFAYVVLHKVGVAALVDSVIHNSASLADRISNATPADAARIRGSIEIQFRFLYLAPVLVLIIGLLVAGLFLATANFGFGGRATYGQALAVWFYGTLPLIFISILTIILLYAGVQSDSFNIKNTVGTNVGYFLQGGDSPQWLITLLSPIDIFAIWSAVLLTIGMSIVAGIKRSSAAIVVFGWWVLYVLLQTAIAAVTG